MDRLPHIEAAVGQAAAFVRDTWQQVVMGTLQVPGARDPKVNIGLRKLYADSISVGPQAVSPGGVIQRIHAAALIANDLENGRGPWDMKPMLLNGPKARVSKKGTRYNIIPFRHGASNSFAPSSNAMPMPKGIYQQARELKASVRQGTAMKWGGRLPATGTPGKNPTTGYQHKHDVYEGMVRIEKTYEKATQSKYMTFRIVSEKSDQKSWWHPGYQAHHIAKGVSDYCRPAVEGMIKAAAERDLQSAIDSISLGVR